MHLVNKYAFGTRLRHGWVRCSSFRELAQRRSKAPFRLTPRDLAGRDSKSCTLQCLPRKSIWYIFMKWVNETCNCQILKVLRRERGRMWYLFGDSARPFSKACWRKWAWGSLKVWGVGNKNSFRISRVNVPRPIFPTDELKTKAQNFWMWGGGGVKVSRWEVCFLLFGFSVTLTRYRQGSEWCPGAEGQAGQKVVHYCRNHVILSDCGEYSLRDCEVGSPGTGMVTLTSCAFVDAEWDNGCLFPRSPCLARGLVLSRISVARKTVVAGLGCWCDITVNLREAIKLT